MQKTVSTRIIERNVYNIYSDDCGKFIDEVEAWDDGYYDDGIREIAHICVNKKWYEIEKVLCDDCMAKEYKRITKGLKDLGFKLAHEEDFAEE